MNWLLTLAFVGTRYHGFQVQRNALSVCEVLQNAMQELFGCRPDVKGCSRTDAGVHARGFCLSFRHSTTIPAEKLPLALNGNLPRDVRVLSARLVPEDFHARYSAFGKEYEYVLLNRPVDDPFSEGLYHRVGRPLHAAAMHEAGQALMGTHDFCSFMAAGSAVEDTMRTVTALQVRREGDWVRLRVAADGFLYNMVRIMAGTLLAVGLGDEGPSYPALALAAFDRSAAGVTLPACGLFLDRVYYSV